MLNTLSHRLRQVPFFANLSDAQLHYLYQQGHEVWLNPGEILFAEGEPVENVGVLLEGELQVIQRINGKEIELMTVQPGTFTGEIPLLAGKMPSVSVRTLRASQFLRFRADTFGGTLRRCFPITTAMLCLLAGLSKRSQSRGDRVLGTMHHPNHLKNQNNAL